MIPLSRSVPILLSILLVMLPLSASSVDLSFLGVSSGLLGSNGEVADEGTNGPSSSISSSVAPPPQQQQCWLDALKIFQPTTDKELQNFAEVCEYMAPLHQKALAFELARCHLSDLGRKMMEPMVGEINDPVDCTATYDNADDDDEDGYDKENSFPNLMQCLSGLTEAGANAYTLFFAQIVSLCNHLTKHLAIGYQEKTAWELAKISHQTVEHFTSIIQSQQEAFRQREEDFRKRHHEFFDVMEQRQEELRAKDASRFEAIQSWTSGLMNSWKQQDQEQKDHHEAWFRNLTSLWEDQAAKMEHHYQKKLMTASRFIQPILTIETWVTVASTAYRLLVITLHFLFLSSAAILMTRPESCKRVRRTLLLLITLETVAEVCVHFAMNDLVEDGQKQELIATLRPTTLCVEALIYAVNLVFSCCIGCCDWAWFGKKDEYDDDDDDLDEEELAVSRAQRDDMRSEFCHLMTETANTATDEVAIPPPPPADASYADAPPRSKPSSAPPRGVSQPTRTVTSETRSTVFANTKAQAPTVSTSLITGKAPKAPETQTTDAADDISRSATRVRKTASFPETNATTTATTNTNALPPVTGLVDDVVHAGKKRSSEEIHSSEDTDSEATIETNAAICSSSPSKRRRVEVVESSTPEKTEEEEEEMTEEKEEYHTAAEESEADEVMVGEDDDSTVKDDEIDEGKDNDKDETEAKEEEIKTEAEEEEEVKMEE